MDQFPSKARRTVDPHDPPENVAVRLSGPHQWIQVLERGGGKVFRLVVVSEDWVLVGREVRDTASFQDDGIDEGKQGERQIRRGLLLGWLGRFLASWGLVSDGSRGLIGGSDELTSGLTGM